MNIFSQYIKERIALFQNKSFCWYLASCIIATFGNGMCYIAMTWLVLKYNTHLSSVAILMTCFWLPNIILGPFFGVITDRVKRKTMLLICQSGRAVLLFVFWFFLSRHVDSLTIYSLALLQGTLWSLGFPASLSITREIVTKDDLLYANSTIDTAYELGNLIGMGAVGFILATTSIGMTFLINACCFALATFFLLMMPHRKKIASNRALAATISWYRSLLQDYVAGLNYLAQHKELVIYYSVQLLLLVSYMTAPILLAPFAKNVLHTTVGEFGAIEAALSVGAVLGGIICPLIIKKWHVDVVVLFQLVLLAIAYLIFGYNRNLWLADFLYFLIGFCFSAWPLVITQAQHKTDLDYQDRVQSTFNSLSGVIILAVYMLLYITGDGFGIQHLYLLEVVFAVLAFILLRLSYKTRQQKS